MSPTTLISQSLKLDSRLLRARGLSLRWKLRFLCRKYLALVGLGRGAVQFRVRPLDLTIRNMSGLGSLQSSIVDFHDDVVASGVLHGSPFIVDVGANIGQFTNAAKLFFPNAHVICFEPDPKVFDDLLRNTRALDHVEVQNAGLGASEEKRTFHRHPLSLMSTFRETSGAETVELNVCRLDDTIDSATPIDLLKIDVEGFEREVLEGGWQALGRTRYLLIELSLNRSGGRDNLQLLSTIAQHAPRASIVRFGRPLGELDEPLCQDALIAVNPTDS
jgi:FkbM family methyltransferase